MERIEVVCVLTHPCTCGSNSSLIYRIRVNNLLKFRMSTSGINIQTRSNYNIYV